MSASSSTTASAGPPPTSTTDSSSNTASNVDPSLVQYRYSDELGDNTPQFGEWQRCVDERERMARELAEQREQQRPLNGSTQSSGSGDGVAAPVFATEEYDEMGNKVNKRHEKSVFAPFMEHIDEPFVERMKAVFTLFDYEQCGSIATEDLGTVLRALGKNVTEEQVNKLANLYDNDGTGTLHFSEFYRIVVEHQPMRARFTEDEVVEYFKVFDRTKSGDILLEDLIELLLHRGEPLSEEDVTNLVRELTIDGDNRINVRQFVQHMMTTSQGGAELEVGNSGGGPSSSSR